jgi:hypothetical protein
MSGKKSFFETRMAPLGVTKQNNTIKIYNEEVEPPISKVGEEWIFREDKNGNIEINYFTIDGRAIVYYRKELKNPRPERYRTQRLKDPKGDRKYNMPRGQGTRPWFHPKTVEAYKKGRKIDTIYLTEGVFKAWKAGLYGLHVVGLSSITHYASSQSGELHSDIIRLMEKCQVKNVVVLWDGDCYNVSVKGIKAREEATRRPMGFFNAVKKTRKLILNAQWEKPRSAPRIFFMSIKSEAFEDKPKGLDDLFISAENQKTKEGKKRSKAKQVAGDMVRIDEKGPYFFKIEITSTTDLLFRHFSLHDAEQFYHRHGQIIAEDEFFFRGDMYHYSEKENKLRLIQPGWAKKLYWVGDEFYEEIQVPSIYGDRRKLEHRKKETLTARFGKTFINHLKYYHGFVNMPSHFNYERIIEREGKEFYNRYFPLSHIIQEGAIENILKLIKHIFGTHEITHPKTQEKIQNYELGLDYLQLILTMPEQQLPILVLYSPENQTGKSTFGLLQKWMLEDNVIFVGNSDLQSDFNEIYADKVLVICEETSLERHKDSERIKNMSTAKEMLINPKGQKQYSIDFFAKFQFYSNKKRMVYLTRHDDRYWILRVRAIAKKDLDPMLQERIRAEVPAFIHYLKNRELKTKYEARMHFNPDLLITDIFMDTVRVNEPTAATDLRAYITEMFLDHPDHDEILMPMKNIKDEFFSKNASPTWIQEILKDYLGVDLKRDANGVSRQERGQYVKWILNEYGGDDGEGAMEPRTIKWKGRPYVFYKKDFDPEAGTVASPVEAVAQKPAINGQAVGEDVPWE